MPQPNVSVIIPVYNVEKYIEKCLHTLFGQSLEDIEFIFIDDGSSDRSVTLIKKTLNSYPNRIIRTKIIQLSENAGVANARNVGLKNASGEYIGWIDPDDWIDNNMFEKMYQKAKIENSDIVWIDYYRETASGQELRKQVCEENPTSCITSYLECQWKIVPGLPFKLAKRNLYSQIKFVPGQNIAEDLYASIMLFSHAKRVSYLREPLYHYRYDSSTSMSAVQNKDKVIKGKREMINNFIRGVEQMEASESSVYSPKSLEYAKLYIRDMVWKYWGVEAWQKCYPKYTNFKILNIPKYKKLNYWCLTHGFKGMNSVLWLILRVKNEILGYKLR